MGTTNNKIPKDKRVARLPEALIDADEFINNWSKTCHFELQSHVPMASSNRYNLMYQGWLFKDIPNDPNRLGCSLYPLVGIYDTFGCKVFNEQNRLHQNDELLHYAGYNCLNWADQHCHLDFGSWNIGSDMSKIIIADLNADIVKFWSVCIDVDSKKVDVSLIYIVGNMNVSNVEGIVRNCNPQKSMKNCLDFYGLFTALFDDFFAKIKNEKSALSQLLFGYDLNEKVKDVNTESKENDDADIKNQEDKKENESEINQDEVKDEKSD